MNNFSTKNFEDIPVSSEWCFKNVRSTEQWTHGYHRYPAKFLPNLVQKLIERYTTKDDLVADMFAGCGTTLVEAKIHGRKSVGVDINPVAQLITNAKTKPIEPYFLNEAFKTLCSSFSDFEINQYENIAVHERIDYWFNIENKSKIAFLYERIFRIDNELTRTFFLVGLSHILKNSSRWLQSSTKPQIDPQKKPADAFLAFKSHVKQMLKKNQEFFNKLKEDSNLEVECSIQLEDARRTTIVSDSVSAIITSPPYVTSYEYADIHQLTGYWFNYIQDLPGFRKNFIGTFYSLNQEIKTNSSLGQQIINDLLAVDKRTAKEVTNYFNDMQSVSAEMYRVLKKGGHACLVIGDTTFKGVKIKSAGVFAELLELEGFEIIEVIKRSIPYKLMPTIRDKKSGRFTKLENQNSKLVYPDEYILIAQK